MTLKSKVKIITPGFAKELLERTQAAGVLNRKASSRTIDIYANEMKRGNWKLNSESIKLDENGFILDGQHRLMACVQSGCTFQTVVNFGVARDTFDTIDCGRIRTGTQVLQMSGVQYHTVITGIINGLSEFRSYGHLAIKDRRLTPSAVLEEYNSRPADYDEAARIAMRAVGESHSMTPKTVGTLYFALVNDVGASKGKAENFFMAINSFDTASNQAIEKMRRWNLANKDRKVSDKLRIAYVIRSWNAFIKGSKAPRFSEHDADIMPSFHKG
jgi:hypothetical protein